MNTEGWLALLRDSVEAFNQYRASHSDEPVDLFEADLSFSSLPQINFEGADLRRCRMEGCNLSGARLDGARMELANLRAATLAGASLRGVTVFSGTFQSSPISLGLGRFCTSSTTRRRISSRPTRTSTGRLSSAHLALPRVTW